MLTFQVDLPGEVEVTFDADGRETLVRVLARLVPGDHEHIFSPSWGGEGQRNALTEDFPNPGMEPVHKVTFEYRER